MNPNDEIEVKTGLDLSSKDKKASLVLTIGLFLCLIGLVLTFTQAYIIEKQSILNRNMYVESLNQIQSRCNQPNYQDIQPEYVYYQLNPDGSLNNTPITGEPQ